MFGYEDANGKKGELLRRAEGKSDAENLTAKLVTELLEKHDSSAGRLDTLTTA